MCLSHHEWQQLEASLGICVICDENSGIFLKTSSAATPNKSTKGAAQTELLLVFQWGGGFDKHSWCHPNKVASEALKHAKTLEKPIFWGLAFSCEAVRATPCREGSREREPPVSFSFCLCTAWRPVGPVSWQSLPDFPLKLSSRGSVLVSASRISSMHSKVLLPLCEIRRELTRQEPCWLPPGAAQRSRTKSPGWICSALLLAIRRLPFKGYAVRSGVAATLSVGLQKQWRQQRGTLLQVLEDSRLGV